MTADDVIIFSGTLDLRETKTFEGKERIAITSEKGSETFVRFNGGGEEVLSQSAGSVKDVIFTKNGKQM